MTLTELINECIRLVRVKKLNDSFMLAYSSTSIAPQWEAHASNFFDNCPLGEVQGTFTAEGNTPEEAVFLCLEKIKKDDRNW